MIKSLEIFNSLTRFFFQKQMFFRVSGQLSPRKIPPPRLIRVWVWVGIKIRIRVGGQFSSGAIVLEPFFRICIQSHLIYIQSHIICIQSHLVYIRSCLVILFVFSHMLFKENITPRGSMKRCAYTFCKKNRKTPLLEPLFNKVTGWKLKTHSYVFPCEFCGIFKSNYFVEHL